MGITKWMDRFLNDVRVAIESVQRMNQVAICSLVQKKLTVRCHSAEIGAHHRGHQPQVQGGRGGRWRRRARPAHQVHSQSGESCQQLRLKCLREISPSCGMSLISLLPRANRNRRMSKCLLGLENRAIHFPALPSVPQC